jgi:hypothetical protein
MGDDIGFTFSKTAAGSFWEIFSREISGFKIGPMREVKMRNYASTVCRTTGVPRSLAGFLRLYGCCN